MSIIDPGLVSNLIVASHDAVDAYDSGKGLHGPMRELSLAVSELIKQIEISEAKEKALEQ